MLPPRFCHELNPADLIEETLGDIRICGILRFQLDSVAIGAISNPSVSAPPSPHEVLFEW